MVRVKFFANFREVAGKKELEIEARTLGELLMRLLSLYPEFEMLMDYAVITVNGRIVDRNEDLVLEKEDVVAVFPPVSGGANAF